MAALHTLATTSEDQTVLLWDVSDPARHRPFGEPLTDHTGPVLAVAFGPRPAHPGHHQPRRCDVSGAAQPDALARQIDVRWPVPAEDYRPRRPMGLPLGSASTQTRACGATWRGAPRSVAPAG